VIVAVGRFGESVVGWGACPVCVCCGERSTTGASVGCARSRKCSRLRTTPGLVLQQDVTVEVEGPIDGPVAACAEEAKMEVKIDVLIPTPPPDVEAEVCPCAVYPSPLVSINPLVFFISFAVRANHPPSSPFCIFRL
jgi:hypothetical protein